MVMQLLCAESGEEEGRVGLEATEDGDTLIAEAWSCLSPFHQAVASMLHYYITIAQN